MATLKAGTTIGSLTPITSGNISTQSVTYATTAGSAPANGGTSAACSGNAATATYATTAGSAPANGGTSAACSGNAATATYATTAGSAPANGGTSAACSGNAATATYATTVAAATDLVYGGLKVSLVDTTLTITI